MPEAGGEVADGGVTSATTQGRARFGLAAACMAIAMAAVKVGRKATITERHFAVSRACLVSWPIATAVVRNPVC